MKTSNFTTRVAMLALLAGVLIYFGVYAARSLSGGLPTVPAYTDTVDVVVEADGLVVRQEHVLTAPSAGAAVELSPEEGERVSGTDMVATLYASPSGLEVHQSIQRLEQELEQLSYAQSISAGAADPSRAEGALVSAMAGLRAQAAPSGDLSGLEEQTLRLRGLLFSREYARGGSAAGELTAAIEAKSAQLSALRASLGAASTVIYAGRSGVFSGAADGFEHLTPAQLERVTPAQLTQLCAQGVQPPEGAVGKVITSSTWYYAALVPEQAADQLRLGESYPLMFTHTAFAQVDMTLERISDAQDGQAVLVFSCRTHLSDTTLLRRERADILTRRITGLRVPRSALRALSQTVQRTVDDGRGGQRTVEEEVSVTGVFVVVSRQAEFAPVEVLYQGEDFFLVKPADPDAADRLRAGDEILPYTAGIFAGKVVR